MKKVRTIYSNIILLLLIACVSCGLKSNPVPYPVLPDRKPVVKNMEVFSIEDTISLKWNFQDKDRLIKYIGIERSEVGTPGNECKDCPRTFERIGEVSVKGELSTDKEQTVLNFVDKKVVRGKIYTYRLMLCPDNGNCPEASRAEINFK